MLMRLQPWISTITCGQNNTGETVAALTADRVDHLGGNGVGLVGRNDICMVISNLSAGGAERVFSQLANAWAAEERRIAVVTFSDAKTDFYQLSPRIQRISVGGLTPSRGPIGTIAANIRRLGALRRAFKASGAPRVLSFTGSMNALTVLAAWRLGLRVCISERNDPARQSLGRVWDFMRRRTYPMADRVTANSHGALASLARFVPAEKLDYVPNPIAQARSSVSVPHSGLTILNVGSLTPQKGQDVLLDAFARIAEAGKEWRLVIVGGGDCDEALRQQAERLGITERVTFIGQVDDPFPYYRTAEIFALPSRFEGTPNVLLEAMSASLPCIVSDASGGPLEYVEDGKTGLVVATDNVDQLAAALVKLMEAPDLRARLGRAGCGRLQNQTMEMVLGVWSRVLDLSPAPQSKSGDYESVTSNG
jgi:GalNAc-alpha-(1->4)-GalNAc-alpha-(1->3)-diNAcBac-PP-undecaprenol alpha-1,4-N-acetyl-D-galactosaminyltransferase